jgi:hypothetical protein
MFTEWFSQKIKKIGFEDIKHAIANPDKYIIINTIVATDQDCLIKNTIRISDEETIINQLIDQCDVKSKSIIVYGRNCNDDTVEKKYRQLVGFGFVNVYLYYGGLFEWMLLQDIYGEQEFPTTIKVIDILKFRTNKILT